MGWSERCVVPWNEGRKRELEKKTGLTAATLPERRSEAKSMIRLEKFTFFFRFDKTSSHFPSRKLTSLSLPVSGSSADV